MAYSIIKIRDVVRVPPAMFAENLEESILKLAQQSYEGIVDERLGVIIAATGIDSIGEGKVIHGDGSAWYDTVFNLLVFKPEIGEVIEGDITEITEFGAFIRNGPIEGLIHINQVMDDFIQYDAKARTFSGKESGKKLKVEDSVLARVITVSLKGTSTKSKIGLTLRQPGLGLPSWKKIDLSEKKESKPKKKGVR